MAANSKNVNDAPPTQRIAQAKADFHAFVSSLANTAELVSSLTETFGDVSRVLENTSSHGGDEGTDETFSEVGGVSEVVHTSHRGSISSSSNSSAFEDNTVSSDSIDPLKSFITTARTGGNFYIVLEEDFDALPLIALYASHCSKTICYTSAPESVKFWDRILSNVVEGCQIISRTSRNDIKELRATVSELASGLAPFILLLAYKVLPRTKIEYSLIECLLFWGLPSAEYTTQYIAGATNQARHVCFILTQEEYGRESTRSKLAALNSVPHPDIKPLNTFEPDSALSAFRSLVQEELYKSNYNNMVPQVYDSFLLFHHNGQGRPGDWCSTQIIHQASLFATRVLLRGSTESGNQRFKPIGPKLQPKPKTIDLIQSDQQQASGSGSAPDRSRSEKLIDKSSGEQTSNSTLSESSTSSNNSKHTYTVLEEDFDAIPLIGYLSDMHAKTVCYISHSKKVTHYRPIAVTSRKVIRPGKKEKSMEKQISRFLDSDTGVLLLRGDGTSPKQLKNAPVDAIICYGISSPGSFHMQINQPNATRTYLVLPTEHAQLITNAFVLKHKLAPHPDSARLTAYGPKSPLLPYRKKTKAALSNIDTAHLKMIYLCKLSLSANSISETARRANKFAATVLLHGDEEDGSEVYRPVGPRLRVTRKEAFSRGLRPAVEQGLVLLQGS